jgi:nucleoid-associated protein YgaU
VTREHKLALIIGFSVFMVVGVLVGDYFSKARTARVDPNLATKEPVSPVAAPEEVVPKPLPSEPALTSGAGLEREFVPVDLPMGVRPPLTQADELQHDEVGVPPGFERAPVPGHAKALPIPAAPVDDSPRHTVKDGNTLYRLAKETYGDANLWTKLRDYNSEVLKGKNDLKLGTVIKLPSKDVLLGKAAAPTRSLANEPKDTKKDSKPATMSMASYTVKHGDTMQKISSSLFKTTKRWPEIQKLNPSVSPETMREGMVLKVPAK